LPLKRKISYDFPCGLLPAKNLKSSFPLPLFARWAKYGSVFSLPPAEPVNKIGSDFFKYTPLSFTFSEIERCCLGAKHLGMVFFRNFEGIFEIQNQSAVGNAEVRRAKLWQNEILQTNHFSFVRQWADERLSAFSLIAQKLILKHYGQHKFTNQKDFSLCP